MTTTTKYPTTESTHDSRLLDAGPLQDLVLRAQAAEVERQGLAARQRRLRRALGDLGLTAVLGRDWAEVSVEGVTFAALGDEAGDRLVRMLEELAIQLEGTGVAAPMDVDGQLELPFGDPLLWADSAGTGVDDGGAR